MASGLPLPLGSKSSVIIPPSPPVAVSFPFPPSPRGPVSEPGESAPGESDPWVASVPPPSVAEEDDELLLHAPMATATGETARLIARVRRSVRMAAQRSTFQAEASLHVR